MHVADFKLCLLTHPQNLLGDWQKCIVQAIQGGVTSVQFRNKTDSYAASRVLALALQARIKPFNIPLIINDDITLAQEINADGVHLGQSDCAPVEARKILGNDKIIGLSIESLPQLQEANNLSCIDYIAASAVFPSKSKDNCNKFWGLDGLTELVACARHPVVAIGGITSSTVRAVMKTGVCGAAVISAIYDSVCPTAGAQLLRTEIDQGIFYVPTH